MCKSTSEAPDSASVLSTGISEQAQGARATQTLLAAPENAAVVKGNALAGTSTRHSFTSATSEHPKIKYPHGRGWIITQSCLNVSRIGSVIREN